MNLLHSVLNDEPDAWPSGTLTFSESPENGCTDKDSTQTTNSEDVTVHPELKFEVVSVRTVEETKRKKHVAYTLRICKDGGAPDPHPAVIERRYSDFLQLYASLKKDFPVLMAQVSFPRKVLIGNFGQGVISSRRTRFESLLSQAAKNVKIHQSPSLAVFLQKAEQQHAQSLMFQKQYHEAIPLLENAFRLLNKLYTDRHPLVIVALCRLVACCAADSTGKVCGGCKAERFAELALRRFEAVSDADLLKFYVPLLQLCSHLWWSLGKDRHPLTKRLEDLKCRGIRVDGLPTLLDLMLTVDV